MNMVFYEKLYLPKNKNVVISGDCKRGHFDYKNYYSVAENYIMFKLESNTKQFYFFITTNRARHFD